MRTRWVAVFASLLAFLLAGALAPATFAAGKKKRPQAITALKITPTKLTAVDTIDVSFNAGRLGRDERYVVGVEQLAGENCTTGYHLVLRGRRRVGEKVLVRLYPSVGLQRGEGRLLEAPMPPYDTYNHFCAGTARITIGRVNPDGDSKELARRSIRIVKDAAYPETLGTPVTVDVLDGSALLVQAPGRPDRTLPIAGSLRGYLPGRFRPNTDLSITLTKGALTLSTITPDPLCAGGTYRLEFPIADNGPSKMVLVASGRSELSLELLADPLSLAGCSLPASPAKTTLTVSGNVGPEGLVKLAISGTVAGVPIAPDVTGTVTMNLLVKVDLSGRA